MREVQENGDELEADELTDAVNGGESSAQSLQSLEDEEEFGLIHVAPRRGTRKNVAQQSAALAMFKGDNSPDRPTIQDWFATVYQWSPQEKLIALVSKLKGTALSVYWTVLDKEKRSFRALRSELISQFQPVRIRAVQSNMFRR